MEQKSTDAKSSWWKTDHLHPGDDQGVVPDPVLALDAAPGVPDPDLPGPAAVHAASPALDHALGLVPASPAVAVPV